MQPSLPPGPRAPSLIQTMGWWSRPSAYMERCRRKYGKRFTIRLMLAPPFVMLSDPDEIKELFKAPPDVLHPGEGAKVLEPFVGSKSVILLDEDPHLEQRKLMLPAFHGKKMEELEGLLTEVAEREVARWPRNRPLTMQPLTQKLTLEVILRAVFGFDEGERLDRMRELTTAVASFADRPISLFAEFQNPPISRFSGWDRFREYSEESDAILYDLIRERRANGGEDRRDVMAMFLAAKHEDGSPMSDQELRDELTTMVVAGHETTASELAWAFDSLARNPRVLNTLQSEIDAGNTDEYLTATINETLRRRPVLPNAEPRLTTRPVTIGDWTYPEGVALLAHAYLVHHDPAIYPDPYAFRPERFLEEPPGTYTFIPFGGGRRRCIGASFATLEMKIVIKTVLENLELKPGADGVEVARRRNITVSPSRGTPLVLKEREREQLRIAA
jgi:cytochrome P450